MIFAFILVKADAVANCYFTTGVQGRTELFVQAKTICDWQESFNCLTFLSYGMLLYLRI